MVNSKIRCARQGCNKYIPEERLLIGKYGKTGRPVKFCTEGCQKLDNTKKGNEIKKIKRQNKNQIKELIELETKNRGINFLEELKDLIDQVIEEKKEEEFREDKMFSENRDMFLNSSKPIKWTSFQIEMLIERKLNEKEKDKSEMDLRYELIKFK